MHTTNPYVGMIATAIQIDEDGFYVNENSDVQIIVSIVNNEITTVSMRKPDAINHPAVYKNNETTIDGQTYRLVFDQNNSSELTLKAIESKPELLSFEDVHQAILNQYSELATSFQLTPNELKIFELLHQANLKRFSIRIKTKKTATSQTKSKTATKDVTDTK